MRYSSIPTNLLSTLGCGELRLSLHADMVGLPAADLYGLVDLEFGVIPEAW